MKTRCTKCVLSSEFPGIEFDDDGICNFCRDQIIATTELSMINSARIEINELINSKRGTSEYDAVVCFSGGKDSTYTLKLAIEKYNLNVLSFTLDNGHIAKTAWDNIHRVVDALGVDHVIFRPSLRAYSSVIRESALHKIYPAMTLRRISAGCNSCISMVNNLALKQALQRKIPLIIAGFTLGQIPANGIIFKNNYAFLKESRQRSLTLLQDKIGNIADRYLTIEQDIIEGVKEYPTSLNILCVEEISEDEIIKEISQLGWTRPGDVDGCSSNCTLNAFNNYIHEQTFGYSPYELELSHLIRSGHLSRDEAILKLEDQPEMQIRAVIEELGLNNVQLNNLKTLYARS